MRHIPVLILAVVLGTVACGCLDSPPAQPTPAPATPVIIIPTPEITPTLPLSLATPTRTTSVSDNTITIAKNTFRPADMTVPVHATVRWVNADDRPHRIEFEDKSFTTSTFLLGSSQSASQRFDRAGSFNYSCMIHPEMRGVITVEG